MRVAFVERALGGMPDVGGRVEIGFADFHVDDLRALGFHGPSARQDVERRFRAQFSQPVGKWLHGCPPVRPLPVMYNELDCEESMPILKPGRMGENRRLEEGRSFGVFRAANSA